MICLWYINIRRITNLRQIVSYPSDYPFFIIIIIAYLLRSQNKRDQLMKLCN